jgi:hypothetical protein
MNSLIELVDETLILAAQVYDLEVPEKKIDCTGLTCSDCKFEVFCAAKCEVKMNLLNASIEDDMTYNLAKDIEKVFSLAQKGIFKKSSEIGGMKCSQNKEVQ